MNINSLMSALLGSLARLSSHVTYLIFMSQTFTLLFIHKFMFGADIIELCIDVSC